MNEIKQLKKLMEAVDESYGEPSDTPYQNYKPEEGNDQYDKKTGEWSRSGQYDHLQGDDAQDDELEERQSIAREPDAFEIEFDSDDLTILRHGGEPALEMPIDDFISLISKFNVQMSRR